MESNAHSAVLVSARGVHTVITVSYLLATFALGVLLLHALVRFGYSKVNTFGVQLAKNLIINTKRRTVGVEGYWAKDQTLGTHSIISKTPVFHS